MSHGYGEQHQTFGGLSQLYSAAHPAVVKLIDPNDNIARLVKELSPNTTTIARVYTGPANVGAFDRYPNAYQYGVDYATLVYSRIKDPSHIDLVESENEPADNYGDLTRFIQRLNDFLIGFSYRAHQLGFRPLGPNFSTGYPECFIPGSDYDLWPNAWQGLRDGLRALRDANGAMGLHEYDAPNLLRLWSTNKRRGFLVGRHKAVYECLPSDLQTLPLYLTEFGIDYLVSGVTGGFWHNRDENAPAWMVDQMRQAWTQVYASSPQLKGICQFLWNRNDPMWEEYDCARTDTSVQVFTSYLKEGSSAPVAIPLSFVKGYPFARVFPVTQGFGENPSYYQQFGLPGHEGIDYGCPTGTPVLAMADGTVVESVNAGNYGLHVRVNHANGWQTVYAHLSTAVAVNTFVKAGDRVGLSGATGNVTGPHLHLTLRCLGFTYSDALGAWPSNVFDPTAYLVEPQGASVITSQEIADSIAYTYSIANKNDLGQHLYGEVEKQAADGKAYIINLFQNGGVVVEKGHYGPNDAKFFDRKTFAISDTPPVVVVPPVVPPTGVVPFAVPPVLPQYGMGAREGTIVAGLPFFRLTGAAIHQGVSAFCKVTVIGKSGVPVIGAHVINKRPDGNFEDIQTDGSGSVQFNFGAASAFTTPGTGPFTVSVATGSDFAVSLGDYSGLHTEITLQFVQQPT